MEEAGAGTAGTCLIVTAKGGNIPIGYGETEAQSSETDLSQATVGEWQGQEANPGVPPALGVSSLSLLFLS